MKQKQLVSLLESKNITVPLLFFKEYKKLNINLEEFIFLMYLKDKGNTFTFDPKSMSEELGLNIKDILGFISSLTDKKLLLIDTFKNDKEIVTVQIGNHAVNGYALEKLSENVYFLYVYDNNYPYDPLSINQKNSMMATRNNLIILRRIEEKYFGTTSTKYRAEYYGALYFNDNDEIDEKVNEIDLFLSNEYFKEYIDESKSDNKYHSVTDNVQIHKDYETLN